MIAPVKQRRPVPEPGSVYRLRVALTGVEPSIWRRLQVPGEATLGWLHGVVQVAMGWMNSHLHQFTLGGKLYSDPDFELNEESDTPRFLDENRAALQQVVPKVKDTIGYEYDFGDSWHHLIVVENILPSDQVGVKRGAACLDGARACPPEDCGGASGYENLLGILRDPLHKEHKSMVKWLGGPFNPEAFSRDSINKYLHMLRWPRVTESQLRRVLMRRDWVDEELDASSIF